MKYYLYGLAVVLCLVLGATIPASAQIDNSNARWIIPFTVYYNPPGTCQPGAYYTNSVTNVVSVCSTDPAKPNTLVDLVAQVSSPDSIAAILKCAAASASGTTYTCGSANTFTPKAQDLILFKADVANTGASTLNVNASGAAPIRKLGNTTALAVNDLLASQWTLLIYDGANWQMAGLLGNAGGGGGAAFNSLTSGTNSAAAMIVGTGGSLGVSGSGTINATQLNGSTPGGTCTNQVVTSINSSGVPTCSGVSNAAITNGIVNSINGTSGVVTTGGTISYTASHALIQADCNNMPVLNGASLTVTLATLTGACRVPVLNLNASALTVSRGGLTVNGVTTGQWTSIPQYQSVTFSMAPDGLNWDAQGPSPIVPGIDYGPATNGIFSLRGNGTGGTTGAISATLKGQTGSAASATATFAASTLAIVTVYVHIVSTNNAGTLAMSISCNPPDGSLAPATCSLAAAPSISLGRDAQGTFTAYVGAGNTIAWSTSASGLTGTTYDVYFYVTPIAAP